MKWNVRNMLYVILSVILILQTGCSKKEDNRVELYYYNPCTPCQEGVTFENAIRQWLEEHKVHITLKCDSYNLYQKEGKEHLEERNLEYGWELDYNDVPAAMMNGKLYLGTYEEIAEQLAVDLTGGLPLDEESKVVDDMETQMLQESLFEEFLVKKDEATIVYFYRVDCQECIDVKPFMENLPATVSVDENNVALNVIRLNSREGENGERIRALFDKYDVPAEDQMVPFVFLADQYLAGQKEIEDKLMELLEQGHGQGFLFPGN